MMTIIGARTRIFKKYEQADKVKPIIVELLKNNPKGLNSNQIIMGLRKEIGYSKEKEEDIGTALKARAFLKTKEKKNNKPTIYKINPDCQQ